MERGVLMGVLISNDAKLEQLLDTAEIEHIVHFVLEAEGVTREVEISLSFVDEEEMHGLNRHWRGIDTVSYTHLDVYKRQLHAVPMATHGCSKMP